MLIESPLVYTGQLGKYQNLFGLGPDRGTIEVTSNDEDGMSSVIRRTFESDRTTSELFRVPTSNVSIVDSVETENCSKSMF